MKLNGLTAGAILLCGISAGYAQSGIAAATPARQAVPVAKERRERAFAAMLEGQRYMWIVSRTRSQSVQMTNAALAKAAFLRAIDADPTLAEAYTAIADLSISVAPGDAEAGIEFANKAIRIDKDNVGAYRVLAKVYTFQSGLNTPQFNPERARLAVGAWKEIARIDARNAEAWAFLAEFYEALNNSTERIAALRKWLAAAQPIDQGFYRRMAGGGEDLRPEAASLKLGVALLNAGEPREAVEVLSLVVADTPDNTYAVEHLAKAINSADAKAAAYAIQPLQQAVFAEPANLTLIKLLAESQRKSGMVDDAINGLKRASERLIETDRSSAAQIDVALGDLFAQARRTAEAVAAYEKALRTRDITALPVAASDRDFAIMVFGKIIETYRSANRISEANAVRDRARRLLETADLFAE